MSKHIEDTEFPDYLSIQDFDLPKGDIKGMIWMDEDYKEVLGVKFFDSDENECQ